MKKLAQGVTADYYFWDETHVLKLFKPEYRSRENVENEFAKSKLIYEKTQLKIPKPYSIEKYERE